MQVTVPEGVGPGMPFAVNTPSGQMQVTCPPGVSAGGAIIVNVPMPTAQAVVIAPGTLPMPTAQAAVVIAPAPLVMGEPLETGPPVLHATPSGAPIKVCVGAGAREEFKRRKDEVPMQLVAAGMDGSEWTAVMAELEQVLQAQYFYNYPRLECVYWCVPGGPIQCVLCLCNPVTCCLCIQPVEGAKKRAKPAVDAILNRYGYEAVWPDWAFEDACLLKPKWSQ